MQQKKSSKTSSSFKYAFLRPLEAFEKSGQYVNGTIFIEGITYFNKQWFSYYGCAVSQVAVAIYDTLKPALPNTIN